MISKLSTEIKKQKISTRKTLKVYCQFSALQFGWAVMLNAFIVSKDVSKVTVYFLSLKLIELGLRMQWLVNFSLKRHRIPKTGIILSPNYASMSDKII